MSVEKDLIKNLRIKSGAVMRYARLNFSLTRRPNFYSPLALAPSALANVNSLPSTRRQSVQGHGAIEKRDQIAGGPD